MLRSFRLLSTRAQLAKPSGACCASYVGRRHARSTSRPALAEAVDVEATVVDTRVPVTIITGFLGSGKTTLLNPRLTAQHGTRIAVIENEFGEVDVDGSLVALQASAEEDVLLLNNGCICCSVRGDLVRMLGELVRTKRDKFDHVVIETTGLANPAPIIQTFYLEPALQDACRLDGVVTLVDAKHVELHLADKRCAHAQQLYCGG